jgi:hypothetical protein
VAKDTLKTTNEDQRKVSPGGTSAKGYAEHEVDGSEYNKFGNRIDLNKLAATSFK